MFLRRFNQIKPCRRKSVGAPRHAAAVFGRAKRAFGRGLVSAKRFTYIDTEDPVAYREASSINC